jgi:hypothetical protein
MLWISVCRGRRPGSPRQDLPPTSAERPACDQCECLWPLSFAHGYASEDFRARHWEATRRSTPTTTSTWRNCRTIHFRRPCASLRRTGLWTAPDPNFGYWNLIERRHTAGYGARRLKFLARDRTLGC